MLNAVVDLLKDEELLEFIADGVFAYYQEQNADNDLADALKRKMAEVDSLGTEGAEFVCRALCSTNRVSIRNRILL